jgi:hypothetical protein
VDPLGKFKAAMPATPTAAMDRFYSINFEKMMGMS